MKNDDFPKRKHPRYKSYDYSSNGCYFVTVCVKDREPLLSRIISVGRDAYIPPKIRLSHIGEVLDGYIKNINTVYDGISVDNYVIMPDHFHLLLSFSFRETDGGMRASRPTLNSVIRSLKTMVTKKIGYSVWQNSFYDTVIKNESSYQEIWQYIESNPSMKTS